MNSEQKKIALKMGASIVTLNSLYEEFEKSGDDSNIPEVRPARFVKRLAEAIKRAYGEDN